MNENKLAGEGTRSGKGKSRKFVAIASAVTALVVGSTALSTGAWGESRTHDSASTRPTTSYPQARPPAGFRSKFAEVDGFRMHYVEGGKGSAIVMMHGFPEDWSEWREEMVPLAKDHTVIAVDLRGAGQSEVPKTGYDAVRLSKDVHQLLTQLKLDKGVQIVAHDIGVWVAYAYGAQYRSEVRSMAVMEAPIPDQSIFTFPALSPDPAKPAPWHFGLFQMPLAEKLMAGHERVLIHDMMLEYVNGDKSPFSAADFGYYAHFLKEPGRPTAWMSVYRGLRTDVEQNKGFLAEGKLKMPILAIGGAYSFGAGVPNQWKNYADNVKGVVLPNTGHFVNEERPKEVTALLRSFLKK